MIVRNCRYDPAPAAISDQLQQLNDIPVKARALSGIEINDVKIAAGRVFSAPASVVAGYVFSGAADSDGSAVDYALTENDEIISINKTSDDH